MKDINLTKTDPTIIHPLAMDTITKIIERKRITGSWPPVKVFEKTGPQGQRMTYHIEGGVVRVRIEPAFQAIQEVTRKLDYHAAKYAKIKPPTDPVLLKEMSAKQRAKVQEQGVKAFPHKEAIEKLRAEREELERTPNLNYEFSLEPLTLSDFLVILPLETPKEWCTSLKAKQASESQSPSPSTKGQTPSQEEAGDTDELSQGSPSQSQKSTRPQTTPSTPKGGKQKKNSSTSQTGQASKTQKDSATES